MTCTILRIQREYVLYVVLLPICCKRQGHVKGPMSCTLLYVWLSVRLYVVSFVMLPYLLIDHFEVFIRGSIELSYSQYPTSTLPTFADPFANFRLASRLNSIATIRQPTSPSPLVRFLLFSPHLNLNLNLNSLQFQFQFQFIPLPIPIAAFFSVVAKRQTVPGSFFS